MGYWSYYLVSFMLAYATQNPAAAILALGFWLCRGFLPDPVVWLRTMGRIGKLRSQIALNPSDMLATRDLARLYLERKRPRKAIALIEQQRERMAESTRHPQGSLDDAELLFALGTARLQAGEPEKALEPLIAAVAIAPEVGRGDPYLVAGDALMKLGRWEEAEDSLGRFLTKNTSSVEAYVKLARARAKQKDEEGSKEAIGQAKHTWGVLPSFMRRHQWPWFAAALFAPFWL
ncbi:MAG TPA: tetratricopeptide repeat protein [Labilithrix sp.]|nr:tetratricopeptide repeat protein [Labilithrix sp.]